MSMQKLVEQIDSIEPQQTPTRLPLLPIIEKLPSPPSKRQAVNERWKVIPSFSDYAVSSEGRVQRITDSYDLLGRRHSESQSQPQSFLSILQRLIRDCRLPRSRRQLKLAGLNERPNRANRGRL
jgi:NUMOD4 motif